MTYHPRAATRAATEARYARVHELWALGLERREIADREGITPQRVSQILRRFGEVRPRPTRPRRPSD